MKLSKTGISIKTGWLRKGIWFAVALLLAGGAAFYFFGGWNTAQAKSASQSTTVTQNVRVSRGDIQISATGSGSLIASQSVDLSFSTTGLVTKLNVKIGDMVKKGDVLALMDKAEALEASLASAQLQLVQAQNTLANLKQNAAVTLAQAHQDLVTAQNTYNTALNASQRTAYARCSEEVMAKYKEAYSSAESRLEILAKYNKGSDDWIEAENVYDIALANYNYCASYTTDEKLVTEANLEVARVSLQLAEEKYNTLKDAAGIDPQELSLDEAKVNAAEVQLANVQKNLEGITLIAPIDGKVVYLAASEGTIVDTSKFITVADISNPTIDLSADETDIDKLIVGSAAKISFDALPDEVFPGKVVQVDPQLTTSGQYQVIKGLVELDSDASGTVTNLPLGVNATVTVINKEAKNALLVPVKALKDLGNQQYQVTVVESNGQTKLQTVQVGIQDGTNAEILSGLIEGDLVQIEETQIQADSSSSSESGAPAGGPPDGGMMLPPQ